MDWLRSPNGESRDPFRIASAAGQKIHNTISNNSGFAMTGNNNFRDFHMHSHSKTEEEKYEDMITAFFTTSPSSDRQSIITNEDPKNDTKHDVEAMFGWILTHSKYTAWQNPRSRSQLLWIYGKTGTAKTWMSVYLTQKHDNLCEERSSVNLYYFCAKNEDKRNTATSILRALITSLLKARKQLRAHVSSEYQMQQAALLSSVPSLWSVFEAMLRDPVTGSVYCVIDGLNECEEHSLMELIRSVANFMARQRKCVVDDCSRREAPSSGSFFKLILVSREEPAGLKDVLSDFPSFRNGRGKTYGNPKLATVAKAVIRQQVSAVKQVQNISDDLASRTEGLLLHSGLPVPDHLAAYVPQTQHSHHEILPSSSNNTLGKQSITPAALSMSEGYSRLLLQKHIPYPYPMDAVELPAEPIADLQRTEELHQLADDLGEERAQISDSVDEAPLDEEQSDEIAYDVSIQIYAASKCKELAKNTHFMPHHIAIIEQALQTNGDGSFLWVDLACEQTRFASPQALEATLAHLPAGVDEMYCQILSHVPGPLVTLTASILKWVVSAKRPLSREELLIVLELPRDDFNNPQGWLAQALNSCSSLIQISKDKDTVSLRHTSVSDFLTSDSSKLLQEVGLSIYFVRAQEMDGVMFRRCIKYLENGCMFDGAVEGTVEGQSAYDKRLAQFPFMSYASSFWFMHLQTASQPPLDLGSRFFVSKSKIRKAWFQSYWTFTMQRSNIFAPRDFNLLHLAARLDIMPLAEALRLNGELWPRLEVRDSHGFSPLDYSIKTGNLRMFNFLVAQGAKTSAQGTHKSSLEIACQAGHVDIVQSLIAMGHNIHSKSPAIHWSRVALKVGRYTHGLFNESVDMDQELWNLWLNADPGDDQMPIHKAAACGHADVVALLLDHGADVHSKTTLGWTPLHFASFAGRMECIELLFSRGADVHANTFTTRWLPLHAAASRGKVSIVQFFLDLHVPINSATAKKKTALHIAAKYNNVSVIDLLICKGIFVDAQCEKGDTALHYAVVNLFAEAVENLLSGGANRGKLNQQGQTPQQTLKNRDRPAVREVIRILETFGLPGYVSCKNTNATKPGERTPLNQASAATTSPPQTHLHEPITKLDSNYQNNNFTSRPYAGVATQLGMMTPIATPGDLSYDGAATSTDSYFSQGYGSSTVQYKSPTLFDAPPPYHPHGQALLTPVSPNSACEYPTPHRTTIVSTATTLNSHYTPPSINQTPQPTLQVDSIQPTLNHLATSPTAMEQRHELNNSNQTWDGHAQVSLQNLIGAQDLIPPSYSSPKSIQPSNPASLQGQSSLLPASSVSSMYHDNTNQNACSSPMQALSHHMIPTLQQAHTLPVNSGQPANAPPIMYQYSPVQVSYSQTMAPPQPVATWTGTLDHRASVPNYNHLSSPQQQTMYTVASSYQIPSPMSLCVPNQMNCQSSYQPHGQNWTINHAPSPTDNRMQPFNQSSYTSPQIGQAAQGYVNGYVNQGPVAQYGTIGASSTYFAPPPVAPQLHKKKSMLDGFFKST